MYQLPTKLREHWNIKSKNLCFLETVAKKRENILAVNKILHFVQEIWTTLPRFSLPTRFLFCACSSRTTQNKAITFELPVAHIRHFVKTTMERKTRMEKKRRDSCSHKWHWQLTKLSMENFYIIYNCGTVFNEFVRKRWIHLAQYWKRRFAVNYKGMFEDDNNFE